MPFRLNFRELIIGKHEIPSRSEFKRLMLTGYIALMCIVVAIIYALLDFLNDVYYSFLAYIILFTAPIATIFLIRKRFHLAAKIVMLISTSFVVFWASINDPFETGVFMFFIPAGMGPFAILTTENYKTALALTCFTLCLFLVSYFGDVSFFDVERPSDSYIKISFILNYLISLTVSILAVYFLMTLNKASEIQLIQKEKLAIQKNAELHKVNEELDRFVYSVSHDLRSPLSSILGLTNLAKTTTERTELDQLLSMIQGRVEAQDNFIKDIINYARNVRTDLSTEPVNLLKLVDQVFESVRYNANAERISFIKTIDADIVLITDRVRLSVILSNLISNAIKYFDSNKTQPTIEISFNRKFNTLSIKDNGIGIQREHIDKIFNMFYRGSDRSTGSGLGLYITKEAANKLGATIDVESTYGEGSTFSLRFPMREVNQQILEKVTQQL